MVIATVCLGRCVSYLWVQGGPFRIRNVKPVPVTISPVSQNDEPHPESHVILTVRNSCFREYQAM